MMWRRERWFGTGAVWATIQEPLTKSLYSDNNPKGIGKQLARGVKNSAADDCISWHVMKCSMDRLSRQDEAKAQFAQRPCELENLQESPTPLNDSV